MQLVNTLASGVRGADNGTARLYVRGTSTRASWYEDFEAEAQNSSGEDLELDAYGRKVAYVNELVDVEVYDSTGTLVMAVVDGDNASNVEVISQSFTGTDYDDGSGVTLSGASKPVTLESVLNLWKDNNGSIDWKVLVDGEARTIKSLAAELSGIVYNVMDPRYGAVGDNTTDDTSAIQATIDAAHSAGGGIVFFPPKTFRVTSALALKDTVSLLGATRASTISLDDSGGTESLIDPNGDSADIQFVQNLTFKAAQATTGNLIDIQNGATGSILHFVNCDFDGTNIDGASDLIGKVRELRCTQCDFFHGDGSGAGAHINNQDISSTTLLENCKFTMSSGAHAGEVVNAWACTAKNCTFDPSSVTSGGVQCFEYQSGSVTYLNMVGTEVFNPGDTSVSVTLFSPGTVPSGGAITEAASMLGSGVELVNGSTSLGTVEVLSRISRRTELNTGDTSVSIADEMHDYGVIQITAAVSTSTKTVVGSSLPDGARTYLILKNAQGMSTDFDFSGTEWEVSSKTVSVASNTITVMQFVAENSKQYEVSKTSGLSV